MSGVLIILVGLMLAAIAGYLAFAHWKDNTAREAVLGERLQGLQLSATYEPVAPERIDAWLARLPDFMRVWVGAADIRLTRELVIVYLAGVAVTAVLVGILAGVFPGVIALLAGLLLPILVIRQLAIYRQAKFAEFLPYFLDSLRQLLVVGNSFQQAFSRASDSANPAIRRYLSPAVRRIRNGAPMGDALSMAADRVGSLELHMLASAVRINQRFGGAIGPVLSDLTNLLRDRARIGREIKSATAEVRASAMVLALLPFAAMALMAVLKYDYISYLWTTEGGIRLLIIAGSFELVGILLMRRAMRLDF